MATLSLKISLDHGSVTKMMQFDPSTSVYDACRIIREKILEASSTDPKEYGLFLTSDEDSKKGVWLESARSLDYYILRNGDVLEYSRKMRNLRVRMLDGTVKTLLVDDSQIVANLMVVICTKIGITNYDEYGLVREEQKEEPDPCDKPNYGTLTLKRRHQDKERDVKMDQLRKKLRTDDEVNWVEPSKTLREQGVDVSETLLLRRKLFFSDRNVDSRDPVQLNLLYVQARDAVLDGTHPVTQEKACEFAGIQCQIQFGDHKEDKHTTGFLDLKEFLPASYSKVKGIEKKVFKEHKRHLGLSELDAKVLYTKSARALKTYGVAFFLVKEKMKGKNKLVPRLLGVTKDSVLRLDEKTKEILQTWPLTTVRRWCASPNTFTLDFGDYSDQYYSVQTTEAEQILQVIAGYIDIILRKQRAAQHLGLAGDEGSAMLEDTVAPHKANIIQHDTFKSGKVNTESVAKPAVLRPGPEGPKSFAMGHTYSAQQTTISGQIVTTHAPPAECQSQQSRVTSLLSEPQRALLSTISSGRELIRQTETELTRSSLPALGTDSASVRWRQSTLDTRRQAVTSHIAAMNAATAQVVTLTSGTSEEVDHTAVGAAITTIASNLPEMTRGVRLIAALLEDGARGDSLLDATRLLCQAFSDLLTAAEPETKEPRQSLLNAASRVGEASTSVLHTIGEEPEDKETQDILLSLAKAVANSTAALVLKAKTSAAQCRDDQPLQNTIISAATQCALAASQLVACTKVVAATLHNPQCREQLTAAARQVAKAVEALLSACEPAGQPAGQTSAGLQAAAREVTESLEKLLAHCHTDRNGTATVTTASVETVLAVSERLAAAGDAAELVRGARELGHATARLVHDIKTEAEKQPSDAQRKLLAAAKLLADATARLVEAARQCATAPQDRSAQQSVRHAAEELRDIAADYALGQDAAAGRLARLQDSARQATSSATQLITSAHNATQYNTNTYSQETLLEECSALNSQIPEVVDAVKEVSLRPAAAAAKFHLITASETLLQTSSHCLSAARSALPAVSEAAAARHLSECTQRFAADCADLRSASSRARVAVRGLEWGAAREELAALDEELAGALDAAGRFELAPLPGQTEEWSSSSLQQWSRAASSGAAQLAAGARGRDSAGAARGAQQLAEGLRYWTASVRATATHVAEPAVRETIITSGRQVLQSSMTLVETVERYMTTEEAVDADRLRQEADDVTRGIEKTIESVPTHAELDRAIEDVNETLNVLNLGEFPQTDKSYGALQSELSSAAAELSSASAGVVAGCSASRTQLAAAARGYGGAFHRLLGAAAELAGQQEDRETQYQMVTSMKTVTTTSSRLLSSAKSASQDLTRPNAKAALADAARAVTDAINQLMDACTEAAPGQKEVAAAARSLEGLRPLLVAPSQPLNDLGYFACLDAVVEQSKKLSEGMSGLASSAKHSAHTEFSRHVGGVASAVGGLVEAAAQAAYLVAVSDPHSVGGRPGLVERGRLARAAAAIHRACELLRATPQERSQVLSAATAIAKHTSALCNACRDASARTAEPQDKRHFVQAAKEVANSTAALVKEIKALDNDYSEENRVRCAQATRPLDAAVRSLLQFADSPEFAAVPARVSAPGRRSQQGILDCGNNIITESLSMLEAARALALDASAQAQWGALAAHCKTLSDCIKTLVQHISDKAPGKQECQAALATLAQLTAQLDQASLAAVAQEMPQQRANTLDGYTEQIENSATEILERLETLRRAAKFEAENLGHAMDQTVSYASPLVSGCVGAASNLTDSSLQGALLAGARTVLETLASLAGAAASAMGNPRATDFHPCVDEHAQLARCALEELVALRRSLGAARGAVRPLLEAAARARARLQEHRMSLVGPMDSTDSYADYQQRMVATAKELAKIASEMNAAAATNPSRLVPMAGELCDRYTKLCADCAAAAQTAPAHDDQGDRLRTSVLELGDAVSSLIQSAGHCRLAAGADNQRLVSSHSAAVNEKVVCVAGALAAGARGAAACAAAAAALACIVGDLDTTILFASAGTLQSEQAGDVFSNHREGILKTAKSLVEDTKRLVGGAAGSQDQLAAAAHTATSTIVELCEVVKAGAGTLGASPDSQVLLLHAARDVAHALRDLCLATRAAAHQPPPSPHMEGLKQAAKVMVTNVTSLLKTVKAVEDENTRGTRALEAAIEAITQEITVLTSPAPPKATATPEELVRATRAMTAATARAVAAGNCGAQQPLTAAANLGRRTVQGLLEACKGAAYSAESAETRADALAAGEEAALAYRALLEAVLGGAAARAGLPAASKRVAAAVAGLLAVADRIKGTEWEDPQDPTVIAEHELLGAAASIDAAARRLDQLRPRRQESVQEADESLNFDEMILDAARSIVAATAALVMAASAAQRELIDQGKVARRPTSSSDDGQWSEGLVSAARLVAAAAHSLVEAANALVQGAGSEERLISSARQVASSTAQLLVACKVKADPAAESTRRLQAAGAAVIRSTDNLVRAAQAAITGEEQRSLVLNRRMVGGIAQEIDARSEVLRIERELEEARGRLSAIRQAKYKLRAGEEGDDALAGYCSDASTAPYRIKTPSSSFVNTTYSPNSTYTPHHTLNQTDLSATPASPSYLQNSQNQSNYRQNQTNYSQNQSNYSQNQSNYSQNQSNYSQNQTGYGQNKTGYDQNQSGYGQNQTGYEQSTEYKSETRTSEHNGQTVRDGVQSPTFSSFRPQEDPKQNYEGFTTRYETRLYDTPRTEAREERFQSLSQSSFNQSSHINQSNQFNQEQKYDTLKLTSPISPKFNARTLKFENSEPLYSTLNKRPFDGVGQTFTEHQKTSELIPGGTKQSEITVKSESYQIYPKTDFTTSTPTKEFTNFKSTDLVKAPTPDFDRVASPYGKDVQAYSAPNFMEETTTEVKEIPNGTQKSTTTKIYSSSPVNITSTNTKYEPVKLEGIDEISKSFDSDSKYSTLDSRFNTIDSKMSSESSRSFKRPSEFVATSKVKDLSKEIDSMDKKLSKQTITSETIEEVGDDQLAQVGDQLYCYKEVW